MTSLNERAELAVLAALLADPAPPLHLYGLSVDDFADPTHRQVFAALDHVAFSRPDLTPEQRDGLIAERVDLPDVTDRTLAAWRLMAPGADQTLQHAEYVRAGAIYRDMAAAAERAAGEVTAVAGLGDTYLTGHRHLLAQALGQHAAAYQAVTAGAPDPAAGDPAAGDADRIPAASARAVLEDQVLAGLIAEPDQIAVVAAFLTDNAFTSSQRRHVYRTLVTMDYDGDGIDDLPVAWRVELDVARAAIYGIDVNAPGTTVDDEVYPIVEPDHERATAYLGRLAVTALVAETVVHAARDLLAEHLHTALPAPTALDVEQITRPDIAQPPVAQAAEITVHPAEPATAPEAEAQAVQFTTAQAPGPVPHSTTTPQPGHLETDPTITPGVRP